MIIDENSMQVFEDLTSESSINTNDFDVMSYVIMPRYGVNLEKLFEIKNYNLSNQLIYGIGI